MHNFKSVAVLIVAGVLIAGRPAAAQNREHLQMAAELRILQEQQAQLALAVAELSQMLAESIKALNSRFDQASDATRKGFADQTATMRTVGDDLRAVRANTQETSTRIGELREEIEALRAAVTSMLSRTTFAPPSAVPLDPNAPVDPNAPAPIVALPEPTPLPPPTSIGLSPERLYGTADADYATGQWTLAIAGYEQFIKAYPTSDRADNAQYQIGEALYAQQQFEEAIAAYNAVIQNYPRGDQVPWAYYKRGVTQRRLQRMDEARASLELAVKAAPGPESNIAILAKQQLDGLPPAPRP